MEVAPSPPVMMTNKNSGAESVNHRPPSTLNPTQRENQIPLKAPRPGPTYESLEDRQPKALIAHIKYKHYVENLGLDPNNLATMRAPKPAPVPPTKSNANEALVYQLTMLIGGLAQTMTAHFNPVIQKHHGPPEQHRSS